MKSSSHNAILIIIGSVITATFAKPAGNEFATGQLSLSEILLLKLVGIPPPPPQQPSIAPITTPPSDEEFSGDEEDLIEVIEFNVSPIIDVELKASKLLEGTPSQYNYYRIASVKNNNLDNANMINLEDGIFKVPINATYQLTMSANIDIIDVQSVKNDRVGLAFCLNEQCNGQLNSTAIHVLSNAVLYQRIIEISGKFDLKINDSVKFFFFKSPSVCLTVLKDSSITGISIAIE